MTRSSKFRSLAMVVGAVSMAAACGPTQSNLALRPRDAAKALKQSRTRLMRQLTTSRTQG